LGARDFRHRIHQVLDQHGGVGPGRQQSLGLRQRGAVLAADGFLQQVQNA